MNRTTHTPTLSARFIVPCLFSLVAASACGESSSPSPSTEGTSTSTSGGSEGSNTTVPTSTASTTSTGAAGTTSTGGTGGAAGTTTNTSTVTTGASGGTTTTGASGTSGTSGTTTSGGSGGSGTSADTTTASTSDSASSGDSTSGTEPSSGSVFHIFLLMGQSNMAGVAKFDAGDKNTDERIKVLGGCNQPANQWNVANPPLSDCPGEKGWNLSDSVDPGIWFAKTIVEKLPAGDTIGLVGTAESGESINTFISGGSHHQMILNKIAKAKTAENARFAGIIFHQGESDSGQQDWPDKVVQLYNQVKTAWGVDYDVPFILGELPVGGCCSGHNVRVHEAADKLPIGAWVSQEGTNVMDEYHFDHASVLLMGKRYGDKMIELLDW